MALLSPRKREGAFVMKSRLLVSLLAIVAGVFSYPASSATVVGRTYSPDRVPIKGALVALSSADAMVFETVYPDGTARFQLETKLYGRLKLRARAPGDADAVQAVDVPAGAGRIEQSFTLQRLTTAQ